MEVVLLLFSFIFVLIAQLLLGYHITPTYKDFRLYKEGLTLIKEQQYTQALQYFEQVLQKKPNSALAWAYKGIAHFFLENYYQTLADCQKAANLDYTLAESYYYKGRALMALEEYAQALHEFEKNIWHSRDKLAEAYRYKGYCHWQLKQYDAAKQAFQKAVSLKDEEANYYLMQLKSVPTKDIL